MRSSKFINKMLDSSWKAQEEGEALIKIILTHLLILMILLPTMLVVKVHLGRFNQLTVLSHTVIKNQVKLRPSNLILINSSWN